LIGRDHSEGACGEVYVKYFIALYDAYSWFGDGGGRKADKFHGALLDLFLTEMPGIHMIPYRKRVILVISHSPPEILSAAKDLWPAFVQHTSLTLPGLIMKPPHASV
jgi:hypothetical protein